LSKGFCDEFCQGWQWTNKLGVVLFQITFHFYFEIPRFENGKPTPRLGDIWIPMLAVTKQCYIMSYMPNIEKMFKIGDMIIKVEHFKTMSKMSSWKLYVGNGWVRDNLKTLILL
jgi:hypothetical protein